MARKVWIEAALNGPWGTRLQPGIPANPADIVAEGIACAKAGAAIIHAHAYTDAGPEQSFDWQVYARIIEGIRSVIDVPVYPSIPSTAIGLSPDITSGKARYQHTHELAARGLLEFAVVDPGSVNFIDLEIPEPGPGKVYANPEDHIREGLQHARAFGFHPAFAIYEPGFTRSGATMVKAITGLPRAIYRFMFSEGFAWGFPPTAWALDAHRRLLETCDSGAPWMIAGLRVDIRPLIGEAVRSGGHVRVGLEDAPLATPLSNLDWVEEAVQLVRAAGGEPASAAEVRADLKSLSGQPPR